MNRKPTILRALLTAAYVLAIALHAGCGMKGPLYLPAPAQAASQPQNTSAR